MEKNEHGQYPKSRGSGPSPENSLLSITNFDNPPKRSSLRSQVDVGTDTLQPRKKRVTIHSQTTILLLQDTGPVIITRDEPQFKKSCKSNAKLVSMMDFVASAIEIILCIMVVAFAVEILQDQAKAGHNENMPSFSIRGLLGTVVVFGICLIALYGVEIWVARKLLEAVQDVDIGRKEASRRASNWRCGNFILIFLEVIFSVCCGFCIDDDTVRMMVPVVIFIIIALVRVLGICVIHQLVQELETVAYTSAPSSQPIININDFNRVNEKTETSGTSEGQKKKRGSSGAGTTRAPKIAPSMNVQMEPGRFLEKQEHTKTLEA